MSKSVEFWHHQYIELWRDICEAAGYSANPEHPNYIKVDDLIKQLKAYAAAKSGNAGTADAEILSTLDEVREVISDATGSAFLSGEIAQKSDCAAIRTNLIKANNNLMWLRDELLRESAHEDGWVSRATKSAPIMQDCMVVVRRYSEGIFLDQWQQVAWRRPDGRWIDDEDLVESSDRYDNRVIEFWHKLKALPCAPEKEKR